MIKDKEGDFFRTKFINYYDINVNNIELILSNEIKSSDILSISLIDCESKIILGYVGNDIFEKETILNNDITYKLNKNIKLLNSSYHLEEIMTTCDKYIYVNVILEWQRKLMLYAIYDTSQTNIGLIKNRLKNIIKDIQDVL